MFASGTTNEVTDDFHLDTVTLRAGFSNTAIIVTSSSGSTASASPGPHLGTATLFHSHSVRHSTNDLTSTVQETRSFMQKIQPTKTSQQRFLSSNFIESAVIDKVHSDTVISASHSTSIGSTVSLSSVRGLSTSVGLRLSTNAMSLNYPSGHIAKPQTSTTSTRLQGMVSFTQNIQASKASQQRMLSSNIIDFEVSVDVYSSKVKFSSHFTSAHSVSMTILSSSHSLSASDGIFLNGNTSSVTKEVTETDREETHTIQPTKTFQQRMFSSKATRFKGN